MTTHQIDHPRSNWSDDDLDRMMVFCLLDRAMPYDTVCRAFDNLDRLGYTLGRKIRSVCATAGQRIFILTATRYLRMEGYRFPETGALAIYLFSKNPIDLRTATREELVDNVWGMGMKLASMFLARTRPGEGPYAILDRHSHRWLDRHSCTLPRSDYLGRERFFLDWCKERELDPVAYDLEIWERSRV